MSLTTSSTLVSLTLSLRHSVWLLSSLVGRQLTPQPNKRKRKQLFFTNSADVDPTLLSSIVHKLSGAEHSFPPKRLLLPTTLDLCDHPLLCSGLLTTGDQQRCSWPTPGSPYSMRWTDNCPGNWSRPARGACMYIVPVPCACTCRFKTSPGYSLACCPGSCHTAHKTRNFGI